MDKDLLRIVIIALGCAVVLALVFWSIFKNKKSRRVIGFYDKKNPLGKIDESLILNTENDDFDIVPLGSALDDRLAPDPITVASQVEEKQVIIEEVAEQAVNTIDVPNIIQFSIVAVADEGFNGQKLVKAFNQVGLEYGSMKIFERLDKKRRVDFAVASMVEPGTFPDSDLAAFWSPGIVFFLQPQEVDKPLAVFDDFIQTIKLLAFELDGAKWDHNRQPLTDETIQQFRQSIQS